VGGVSSVKVGEKFGFALVSLPWPASHMRLSTVARGEGFSFYWPKTLALF